jgi:hypothetical protein
MIIDNTTNSTNNSKIFIENLLENRLLENKLRFYNLTKYSLKNITKMRTDFSNLPHNHPMYNMMARMSASMLLMEVELNDFGKFLEEEFDITNEQKNTIKEKLDNMYLNNDSMVNNGPSECVTSFKDSELLDNMPIDCQSGISVTLGQHASHEYVATNYHEEPMAGPDIGCLDGLTGTMEPMGDTGPSEYYGPEGDTGPSEYYKFKSLFDICQSSSHKSLDQFEALHHALKTDHQPINKSQSMFDPYTGTEFCNNDICKCSKHKKIKLSNLQEKNYNDNFTKGMVPTNATKTTMSYNIESYEEYSISDPMLSDDDIEITY